MKIYFLSIFLFCFSITHAQKGILTGKIVDQSSGESLIGAVVEIKKDSHILTGTSTDFDGNYSMEIEAGVYDISVSYLSYIRQTIHGAEIFPKQITHLEFSLQQESQNLSEVVVKAEAIRTTEVALIALQRQAYTIQDGISSQQISRTGSSNAAEAVRQMPGAVVEGDRYIVVRGLGDRYSISQLNGAILPGTDPYRNSTSMDMIPSQLIDNIISVKTFTPDLPGNFSGGLINVSTKGIPDRFNMSISFNTSYNSQSSLNENFQSPVEKGKYDWLGFDDGTRDQPTLLLDPSIREELSSSTYLEARRAENETIRNIFDETSKSLSTTFVPVKSSTPLNLGFNFSLGNRFRLFNKDLGFTLGINYASSYSHYDNGSVATYINTNTAFLFPFQNLSESKSVHNPNLGGLFNLTCKLSDNHIINGNIIFNNDAEIIASSQQGGYLGQISNSLAQFNTRSIEFIQRQMKYYQLGGRHIMPKLNNIMIKWNGALTGSFQHEPDVKYFAYTTVCGENGETGCEYYINNAEYAFPYHFFRKLIDKSFEGKFDFTLPLSTKRNVSNTNSFKIGGLYSSAQRDFEEYRYQLNNSGVPSDLNFNMFDGDFDSFFDPSNFGIIDTIFSPDGTVQRYVTGYHYINQINARNFYRGRTDVASAYAMLNWNITHKLKAISGLRMEATDIEVISRDTTVDVGQIKQADFLYSANLIYQINEISNFRLAATQTLARPNMRELAPFVQFDNKNGFFNVGNPNLKRTLIQNYDLRYELYPKSGELIAISGFYKNFSNPIIRAFNPKATIPELSFINVYRAIVAGAELEVRKSLHFIHRSLEDFYINTNLAIIHSEYRIPQEEIDNSKNIDPEYDQNTRPFQGQAPYIVNAILGYINPESGWEVALSYNVSGPKLYNISLFATPDVYEQPVSMLNLKIARRFAENYQMSLTVKNILNSVPSRVLHFNGKNYIAESYPIGRTIGASLTYQIR